MNCNVNRQHVLSLFDTLHDKYQFQDGEYKELVEALGGKKKPLDVKNAKFVVIKFDRYHTFWDDEAKEDEIVANYNEQSLCQVYPHVSSDEHWYHQTHYNISQSELEQLVKHHSSGRLAPSHILDMKFRVIDIEVLERN